eukprot:TRINITY_DN2944_c1_g5_i1.p1 TRINITY_DN2944_c1_g5~~TRINITY_DN2944_c1_g5_i1.p1  ORF type:complete len:806 (+),score=136.42 TRINITY_DN2944_c1_g5_i1:640-3057(+)
MHNLEILDLQGNGITSIPGDAFTGCTSMKLLNLRGNRLTSAPCMNKCGVLELLLDGNAIQSLQSFPDDVGMDAWFTLKRLGLSNNKITDWTDLRYLAAMEHLEAADLRTNPFEAKLPFEYKHLLSWLCPLLTEVNNEQVSSADFARTRALFHDSASNGISDIVLQLDDPSATAKIAQYLASVIPKEGLHRRPMGGSTANTEQISAMGKKIKEMSQIVRVLHGAHMTKRRQAAGKIQAWYRGIAARTALGYQDAVRLKKMKVYNWPKKVKAATGGSRLTKSINQETAVYQSRRQARAGMRIFTWEDDPRRLMLRPCKAIPRRGKATKRDLSAILIQKMARGFLVRLRLEQIRLRHYAAETIQAAWKGYRVREWKKGHRDSFVTGITVRHLERKVGDLTEQNQLLQNALRVLWNESRGMQIFLTRARTRAAIKIQSIFRMHLAKKRVRARKVKYLAYWRAYKSPLLVLQRVLRGYGSRREVGKKYVEHQSAVDMQKMVRGHLARNKAEALKERQRDRDEIQNLQRQVTMLFSMVKELAERKPVVVHTVEEVKQQPPPPPPQPVRKSPSPPTTDSDRNMYECNEDEEEEEEEVFREKSPPVSTGLRFIGSSQASIASPPAPSVPQLPVRESMTSVHSYQSGMGSSVAGMGLPLKASVTSLGVNSSISAIHESLRLQQLRRQEQQEQLRSYVAGIGLTTSMGSAVPRTAPEPAQEEDPDWEDEFPLHQLKESPLQQLPDDDFYEEGSDLGLDALEDAEEEEEPEEFADDPEPNPHYRYNDLISPPTRAPPSPPRASYGRFELDDDETSL